MRIQIIAVGDKMPAWVEQGYQEYIRRIGPGITIELHEVAAEKRSKGSHTARILEKEAQKMRQAIAANRYVIALDKSGQSWSTEQLARHLSDWQLDGTNLSLLIGGPEGMTPELVAAADKRWSLSALTFPHPVVRIVLAEQLYRAWSILNNHPYHK